jgi:hypothetical protein
MSTSTAAVPAARIPHEPDHGFCAVCGAVWPCWRAAKALRATPEPALRARPERALLARPVPTAA